MFGQFYAENKRIYYRKVNINLDKDFRAGIYPIEIRVYREGDQLEDVLRPQLGVTECVEKKEEVKVSNETVIVQTGQVETTQPGIITGQLVSTPVTEISFTESSAYIALLVLANIIIVGGIIVVIAKVFFFRR